MSWYGFSLKGAFEFSELSFILLGLVASWLGTAVDMQTKSQDRHATTYRTYFASSSSYKVAGPPCSFTFVFALFRHITDGCYFESYMKFVLKLLVWDMFIYINKQLMYNVYCQKILT
jgi:hypothetical protein